jgi:glycosidase
MLDRFDDGDPSNNDQGVGEYDPDDHRKYSGGDLAGAARRIDYIKGLGATAVWITPPVANQWLDERAGYGGYHGYWAENFMKVDAHYGTLDDYKALSHALHSAGMYLVQDVVVNHTGNFFSYIDDWNPSDPTVGYSPNPGSLPVAAPTQWPFSLNDPRRAEDREAAVYHWTPTVSDFGDRWQEQNLQLADLDDLNTESPLVRRALRESYGHWIREVGVDAFRIDTAYHVPAEYFRDFLHAEDPEHPGVMTVARDTGRDDFLAFGEGFGVDKAFDDRLTRKLDGYMRDGSGAPLLPSMINFPLYGGINDALARGRPTAELGYRIRTMMRAHADPHRMPSFIDNHDVDRFLAGGSEAALRQALLMLMTLPGIPTIYYGTEQGFTEPRRAMFAAGHGSGGRDHFDTEAPLYRYLQSAIALRRNNPVFSRGTPEVLHENGAAAGAFAYRMRYQDQAALVVFNTADADTLMANLDTGLPAGTRLKPLFAIAGDGEGLTVGGHGLLTLTLPARAGLVWVVDGATERPIASTARISLDESDPTGGVHGPDASEMPMRVTGDFDVSGYAEGVERFLLVVDGELAGAQTIAPGPDGRWQARIDTASMIDPGMTHSVVAWSASPFAVSTTRRFQVERAWQTLADIADPAGDDSGPEGRYRYPEDPTWGDARHMDMRRVRVEGAGGALRVEVEMSALSAIWNPANGFDHVAFTLFIELPGREDGLTVMPMQNAELPDGMRWHYRLRAGGWSNALFSTLGASADSEGTPSSPGAGIEVDSARRTVRFTLPAAALGRPDTLSGARLYLTTWDYDGRYRPLIPEGAAYAFGGGDGTRDPLVMDEVLIDIP